MNFDDSTLKAFLKRKASMYIRRRNDFFSRPKQEKKHKKAVWVREAMQSIEHINWVINKTELNKHLIGYYVMSPTDERGTLFSVVSWKVDKKKCFCTDHPMGINITNHFLIRLMQYRRISKLSEVHEDVNDSIDLIPLIVDHIIDSYGISASDTDSLKNTENMVYEVYSYGLGFIPILYEVATNGKRYAMKFTFKTLIKPDSLGVRHRKKYDKLNKEDPISFYTESP